MDCLGCLLATGKIETQLVYENELLACFLDYNPYNEGHLLVLPKRHIAELTECSPSEVDAIFQTIQRMSSVIKQLFTPDGITVLQNGGMFNELTHLHIHIIPRYKGQNFAEFYIEQQSDIDKHAHQLPITKAKIIEALKRAECIVEQ